MQYIYVGRSTVYFDVYISIQVFFIHYSNIYTDTFWDGECYFKQAKTLGSVICLLQAGRGASGVDGDQKTADSMPVRINLCATSFYLYKPGQTGLAKILIMLKERL